ncbi:tRNA 2-thiouridine(34) synthase MnmA [Blattabacterium cuenoti]|uniref:tRNA 2-thiouridine(34) synthase MnmA n=1 Tax=Blattabacterium cuenoti TaxID=1653831 RepID=UPI00163B8E86|nr:tRNA 2-thiouridine(34) synthase MnmA [Blattabacterium cuenoti]
MKKVVVVALSGGVDSSVSALILKKSGYNVIGLFMNNWDDKNYNCSLRLTSDSIDAMVVANKLNIPFQIIEMKKEYNKYIINYMFNEYKIGNTPNPDILCNKIIKFNLFLKIAIRNFNADFIATGHYVKKVTITKKKKKIHKIFIGKDLNKDQSYFLCQLNQTQLQKSLFPLGMLTKKKVRKIAEQNGLYNAYKKDSQGLCFVGKITLSKFLHTRINPKKGKIINIKSNSKILYDKKYKNHYSKEELILLSKKIKYKESDGKIIGYHQGAYLFTIGQRKGISIGGFKNPIFVIDTDIKKNIVYTGMGKNHPGLYRKCLFIKEKNIHWIHKNILLTEEKKMNVLSRIRYRQPLQKSFLYKIKTGILIIFENMQYAISGGQFAVWYNFHNELIGSGIISE